jgi:hypothetical protein
MPNITVSNTINSLLRSSNSVAACSALNTLKYEIMPRTNSTAITAFSAKSINGNVFGELLTISYTTGNPVVIAAQPYGYIQSNDNDTGFTKLRTPTYVIEGQQIQITISNCDSGTTELNPKDIFNYSDINIISSDGNSNNDTIIVNTDNSILPNLNSITLYCYYSSPIITNLPRSVRYISVAAPNAGDATNLDSNLNTLAAILTTNTGGFFYSSWNGILPTAASQTARNALTARGWILTFS